MPDIDWSALEDLFHAVADLAPEARAAYLDRHCPDPDLRREVESLLAADGVGGTRVGSVIGQGIQQATLGSIEAGQLIGPYRVVRAIGEGGMGAVYLAERDDGQFRQQVAIKVLRSSLPGPELMARFRHERQILAGLRHPNIASLLDGGASDTGMPYLVMEYVQGLALDRHCREQALDLHARLALFQKVCAAVQAAHQNLIIHRDIKPANVLVDAGGEPKLLDFGIAKLADEQGAAADSTLTAFGGRAFTPEFASPEQVRGQPVTTASDVYSLGVLLYGLITGRSPYARWRTQPLELQKAVCETDPPKPSDSLLGAADTPLAAPVAAQFRRALKGDLDHIVLKAMRKEPGQRYASPAALAEDIRRFCDQRPIEARRGSRRYVLTKFLRRNALPVSAAAAVTVAIAGTVAFYTQRLQTERDVAERERVAAQEMSDFAFGMFRAANPSEQKPGLTAVDILARGAERIQTQLTDQPRLRARMLYVLAGSYWAQEEQARAEDLYRQAIETALSAPDGLQEAANAAERYALALQTTDRFEDTRQAIKRARDLFGRLHRHTGPEWAKRRADFGLDLLGVEFRSDGRTATQEQYALIQDIKQAYQEAGRRNTQDYAIALVSESNWHKKRFEWPQAIAILTEALGHSQGEHGEGHIRTAFTVEDLARTLYFAGDYAAARIRFEQFMDIVTAFKGADSADLTWTLYYLARIERESGGHARAVRLVDRLIAIETASPATDDQRYLARALALRALLRADAGDLDAAQAHAERSHELLAASDQTRVQMDVAHEAWVTVALARGDTATALEHGRALDAVRRLELDPAQTDTPQAITLHASALAASGDVEGAAALYAEAIDLAEQRYDPQYPTIGRALWGRARMHSKTGDETAAAQDRARAQAIFQARGMVPQTAAWTLPAR